MIYTMLIFILKEEKKLIKLRNLFILLKLGFVFTKTHKIKILKLLLLFIVFIAFGRKGIKTDDQNKTSDSSFFQQSEGISMYPTTSKIFDNLISITPENKDLIIKQFS